MDDVMKSEKEMDKQLEIFKEQKFENWVFQIDELDSEMMEQKKVKDIEGDIFEVRILVEELIEKHRLNTQMLEMLNGQYRENMKSFIEKP